LKTIFNFNNYEIENTENKPGAESSASKQVILAGLTGSRQILCFFKSKGAKLETYLAFYFAPLCITEDFVPEGFSFYQEKQSLRC
jgi:hypothetical protein